jgi:pimeloyl-ACP methyl ester carboxylesterase
VKSLQPGLAVAKYQAKYKSSSHFFNVRGLQYHVREWFTGAASEASATVVLLHGWMDVSASFQFMVDALQKDWRILAIDWRGFGLTSTPRYDTYWFPDYLADLEMVLDALKLNQVNLVGHSMGGNVAMLYAGVRPERIAKLVNLEGAGMPPTHPNQAASRYRRFLDELKTGARLKSYASLDEVAARLMKNNARLTQDKAVFLAAHWSKENGTGEWELLADPAHKLSTPILYRVEEVLSLWRRISAPTLMVLASERDDWHKFIASPAYRRRLLAIPNLQLEEVPEVGHMLHHDRPEVIASLIETFLS